jgi:hypothetical protein
MELNVFCRTSFCISFGSFLINIGDTKGMVAFGHLNCLIFFSFSFFFFSWRFATHFAFLSFLIQPLDHEKYIQGGDSGGRRWSTEVNWFSKGLTTCQGRARQDKAGQGRTRKGRAGQGRAGQGSFEVNPYSRPWD